MVRVGATLLLVEIAMGCGPSVTETTEGGTRASSGDAGLTSTSGTATTRAEGGTGAGGTTQAAETTGSSTTVESDDSPVADLPAPMCTTGDAISLSAASTPGGSYPATHGFFRWVACCPTQEEIILLLDGVAPAHDASPRLVITFEEDGLTGIHPAIAGLTTREGTFEAEAEVEVVGAVSFPEGSEELAATVTVAAEGWDFQAEVVLPHCGELDIFCPC